MTRVLLSPLHCCNYFRFRDQATKIPSTATRQFLHTVENFFSFYTKYLDIIFMDLEGKYGRKYLNLIVK